MTPVLQDPESIVPGGAVGVAVVVVGGAAEEMITVAYDDTEDCSCDWDCDTVGVM